MDLKEFDALLHDAEVKLKRLKALYEQWFQGIERLEPSVVRKDLERLFSILSKEKPRNTAARFRFQQMQARYSIYTTYWGRVARQIEEGTYERDIQKVRRRGAAQSEPKEVKTFEMDLDAEEAEPDLGAAFEEDEIARALDALEQRRKTEAPPAQPAKPFAAFSPFAKLKTQAPPASSSSAPPSTSPGATPSNGAVRPADAGRAPGTPRVSPPAASASPQAPQATAGASPQAPQASASAPRTAPASTPTAASPSAGSSFAHAAGSSAGTSSPPVAPAASSSAGTSGPPAPSAAEAKKPVTATFGKPKPAITLGSHVTARPSAAIPPQTTPAATAPRASPPIHVPRPTDAPRPPPPVGRPAGAAAPPKPPPPPPKAPQPKASDDSHMRTIYERYIDARRRNNEPIDNVRYEKVVDGVQKMTSRLREKHGDKRIDFEVVVQNGKVGLKPKIG